MDQWAGVVLAAGMGTRMKSSLPKVLHKVCGRSMILYPVQCLREAGIERIVVVVSPLNEEAVGGILGDSVEYVCQPKPLGTGHAVLQAGGIIREGTAHVAVMGADSPLVTSDTFKRLIDLHLTREAAMTLLSAPECLQEGLGRLVRGPQGQINAVVEAADFDGAPPPPEVNGGAYCFSAPWLWDNLTQIPMGQKGEFYLTSLVAVAASQGARVEALSAIDSNEVLGVNDRAQLAQAEGVMYQRIRYRWMLEGVTMVDPSSIFIDASAELAPDTTIYPNTMVLGYSSIRSGCIIGPGSVIRDSAIGERCRVTSSFIEEATLESDVDIGPFSHLRPGAYLESKVHLGNFCEVKNSRIGSGSAMGHFGYVGDATIGAKVNVGAGTVTCNYDGVSHLPTVVEEGAFIGSDTMLVAPVRIGQGAITGAGSVVTHDVPANRLAVGVPAKIKKSKKTPGKKG